MLIWFGIYVGAITLCASAGASPLRSIFGDFERMGGVWSWLHFLAYYFVLRSTMNDRWWRILLFTTLLVADATVFAGPMLGQYGYWGSGFARSLALGSRLGNPGLLGPFLLLSSAISAYLLVTESRALLRAAAAVSLATALVGIGFTANRSSEIGLLTGLIVGAGVFLKLRHDRRRVLRWYALILSGIALLAVAGELGLVSRAPTVTHQLLAKWIQLRNVPGDPSRLIEWRIAEKGFLDRPLLGYGPENHRVVESAHFDPGIYRIAPDTIFDRAHNAWLELLATTGLLGTIAMLGIWIAAIGTIRRGVSERKLTAGEAAIFTGALVAYAVFLTFWFFDISSVMIWVALLALISGKVRGPLAELDQPDDSSRWRLPVLAGVGLALAAAVYFESIIPLRAAHDLDAAIQTDEGVDDHLAAFYRVMDSPAPQIFHTPGLFNQYLSSFSDVMHHARENPSLDSRLRYAFSRGFRESTRNIAHDPLNDRAYLERARLLVYAGDFYGDTTEYAAAARSMWTAIQLSPLRTYNRLYLSDIYLMLGDTISARAQLDSARRITPDYFLLPSRLSNLGMTP